MQRKLSSLRKCIENSWESGDFAVFKVDMSNAFNRVSRQAVLDECSLFFPELLPWVSWCYDSHSILWHPKGTNQLTVRCAARGPAGPNAACSCSSKACSSIEADDGCFDLSLNLWYLDDGVLAGERSAVVRALHLIEELGHI